MNNTTTQKLAKRIIHWLLIASVMVLGISGFGITEFRIVEPVTSGLLTKAVALKIHTNIGLWVSFLVLLITHICLSLKLRSKNKAGSTYLS